VPRLPGLSGHYSQIDEAGQRRTVPGTESRMRMRNWMLKSRLPLRMLLWMTGRFATGIGLKNYPALLPAGRCQPSDSVGSDV
jgi:hypothetical protein